MERAPGESEHPPRVTLALVTGWKRAALIHTRCLNAIDATPPPPPRFGDPRLTSTRGMVGSGRTFDHQHHGHDGAGGMEGGPRAQGPQAERQREHYIVKKNTRA